MRSWGGMVVTSSPKKRTVPAVGGKSPVTVLNKVVLPAPLAPIRARRSPAATESETSSIARRAPKVRVTPSSTRASPDATGPWFVSAATDSRAVGRVARAEAHLVEIRLAHAQKLVDVRHHLDDLVVEGPVWPIGHLGDKRGPDRLAVLVECDHAGWCLELQVPESLTVLGLTAREVALDRLQRVQRRLHVDVVDEGEQRWAREAVLEVGLVVRHELLPVGAVEAVRDG